MTTTTQLCMVLSLTAMLARAPLSTLAFVSSPPVIPETNSVLRQQQQQQQQQQRQQHRHMASTSRWGPKPLLASANPDVLNTESVIADMEKWTSSVSPETNMWRDFEYKVSMGTTLPEVLFDFWKAVSEIIDEHRATKEHQSLRRVILFVAPFCEELREYETMEHTHQLLQHSASDGGCKDFGKEITHFHYHPNFRYIPKPEETRMTWRHSPHPAFSIDGIYRTGGLKSLRSIRAAALEAIEAKRKSPPRPRADVPQKRRNLRALRRNEEWAKSTRSSLEALFNTAASYGAEGELDGDRRKFKANLPTRGEVPESSQEILQATQAWLKGVLKDAVECDTSAATSSRALRRGGRRRKPAVTNVPTVAESSTEVQLAVPASEERSTAFKPPSAAEVTAAIEASHMDRGESGGGAGNKKARDGQNLEVAVQSALDEAVATTQRGLGKQPAAGSSAPSTESGAESENVETPNLDELEAPILLPGKELVKRMSNIAQYLVSRSTTAEEVYTDVWEIVTEMAGRAATRGCSIPTEDYSSRSSPCYSAVLVTPDLATYNAQLFFRFQEILNRGLRHLPMEHDISVEAFHPETVSDASPLDHHFRRSPYPTLHICYHGVREKDTALHPAVMAKKSITDARKGHGGSTATSSSGGRRKSGKKNGKKNRKKTSSASSLGATGVVETASRGGATRDGGLQGTGTRGRSKTIMKGDGDIGAGGGGGGGEEATETAPSKKRSSSGAKKAEDE